MFAHNAVGRHRRLPSGLILASGVAALLAAAPGFAATRTWNGSQGNDNWTNTLNWTPAGVPNDGTSDVIFAGTTRPAPDMNANWSVNSVAFNNTAGAFTLLTSTASTLTVGAGGFASHTARSAASTLPSALGEVVANAIADASNRPLPLVVLQGAS